MSTNMLCCLCNKHTTCPFCSTTTTQQPATGAATTPPAAPTHTTPQHHQSSTSWPLCRPAHHQVMPRPATLLRFNNTPVWPFAPVHTHHQVCVMASPHTTQPSTTGMCICGCVWCTVVGLHTHSFCVGFTTPQTPCAGSSMCHAHTNCTTTHTAWCGAPCHATTPHTWLWWLCVVQWWVCWLVGTTSIFACHALHVVCCTCFFTPQQPCPFVNTHTAPSTQQQQPLHRLVPPWQQPPAHKPCQSTTLMACGVWCCVCCT